MACLSIRIVLTCERERAWTGEIVASKGSLAGESYRRLHASAYWRWWFGLSSFCMLSCRSDKREKMQYGIWFVIGLSDISPPNGRPHEINPYSCRLISHARTQVPWFCGMTFTSPLPCYSLISSLRFTGCLCRRCTLECSWSVWTTPSSGPYSSVFHGFTLITMFPPIVLRHSPLSGLSRYSFRMKLRMFLKRLNHPVFWVILIGVVFFASVAISTVLSQ